MTQLTDTGFQRTRLLERFNELQAEARAIFGNDIDLSSDTMDGQHLGLFAEAIADIDELAEMVWTSFDPDSTTGTSLSRLVKINGIERSQGAKSVVNLTLTGVPSVLVPQGSIVSNANDTVTVYTLEDARIGQDGTVVVKASPEFMGAINADAGALNVIKSPLYGWSSVTNFESMTIGKSKETDAELRVRRRKSVSKGNRNMTEALSAALADLDGVIEVSVLENATPKFDAKGLPAHSIHAVVLGGAEQAIAEIIWTSKTGGTVLAGNEIVSIIDETGNEQLIRFSRPSSVKAQLRINITPRTGWTFNKINMIKESLSDYIKENIKVGDSLILSDLYTPLNAIGGFSIEKIEAARLGGPLLEQPLNINFYERLSIDYNDIEVTQNG